MRSGKASVLAVPSAWNALPACPYSPLTSTQLPALTSLGLQSKASLLLHPAIPMPIPQSSSLLFSIEPVHGQSPLESVHPPPRQGDLL